MLGKCDNCGGSASQMELWPFCFNCYWRKQTLMATGFKGGK